MFFLAAKHNTENLHASISRGLSPNVTLKTSIPSCKIGHEVGTYSLTFQTLHHRHFFLGCSGSEKQLKTTVDASIDQKR